MLNPECHLKFLEENLNFLSRKPTRCNDFKISSSKSSSYSVETLQNVFSLPEDRLPSLTFASLSEGSVSQLKTIERKFDNGSCKDTVVFDGSKMKMSNGSLQKRAVDKPFLATSSIIKIKEKYSSKNDRNHEFHPNLNVKPVTTENTAEIMKNKTDSDNQFEFTVAGEKIVSFVCSPPTSRRPRTKESEKNCICDSDEESIVSSSKGSSETASSTSSKSSYSKYIKKKETLPVREQMMKTNMLLWHPPSTSRNDVSLSESKAIYSGSSFNRQIKPKPTENCINFFGTINSLYAVASSGDRSLKNAQNQETVMFRETALRGCYDIETLLRDVKTASPEVEKEVSQTREAIFSAVRLQRGNDSIVSDSVQSIVDICNSWIKLNAHFERKDFKHFLETNGVDLTILGDFSQWQCMSRMFVDKLINVLKKVSLGKGSKITRQHDPIPTRGYGTATVQSDLEVRGESTPNNIHRVVPSINTNLPATDTQGKRWKQRRFLSEKIDSEKVALTGNRPCRSTFTVDSCFQNSLLVSSCNTETVFGQGDNCLNFARDFSKVNHVKPQSCQFAQGDVSFFNGSKHCSNSGFFDKNINVPSMKCSVRGETNVCPVSSANDLCTPVSSLVDMPLNNYFPVNIQQAVPTVPPLYNNQLCLVNASQYQPSFNHSLAKPNPIHCIDSDNGENYIQSSYMKPGHYAPPQKPASFQKAVNNTIPIEDIPAVGIPFLYSAPYSSSQQPKSLEFPNSLPQIQMSKDNNQTKDSDVTWKTALSMAGPFRDNMMTDRIDDGPNLKLSETVSLKSHFLLSDGNSQNSSSSGDSFKLNSDNDERSSPSDNNSNMDFPVTKSKTKTSDWLVGSFNKMSLENEHSLRCNIKEENVNHKNEQLQVSKTNEEPNKLEYKESYLSSSYLTNVYSGFGNIRDDSNSSKKEEVLGPFLKTDTSYLQKKLRKNKKGRDDYTLFDWKNPMLFNKPETMVFSKSMSNKVTCQLEDILNCIWNTKVSTLIDEEIKSEKVIFKYLISLLHFCFLLCSTRCVGVTKFPYMFSIAKLSLITILCHRLLSVIKACSFGFHVKINSLYIVTRSQRLTLKLYTSAFNVFSTGETGDII